jgi:hypothetical protein
MYSKADPLWYFKIRLSKNDTGTRFKHTEIDKLPSLQYRFAEGNNWKATDYRVSTKWKEISQWFDKYWESRPNPNSVVNRGLYERELEKVVLDAISQLNERWNTKLEREFEETFDDKMLGFLSGTKQNSQES